MTKSVHAPFLVTSFCFVFKDGGTSSSRSTYVSKKFFGLLSFDSVHLFTVPLFVPGMSLFFNSSFEKSYSTVNSLLDFPDDFTCTHKYPLFPSIVLFLVHASGMRSLRAPLSPCRFSDHTGFASFFHPPFCARVSASP